MGPACTKPGGDTAQQPSREQQLQSHSPSGSICSFLVTDGFRQPSSPPVQAGKQNTCTQLACPPCWSYQPHLTWVLTTSWGVWLAHSSSNLRRKNCLTIPGGPLQLIQETPTLACRIVRYCVCRYWEGDNRLEAPLQNKTLLFGPWSLSGNGLWSASSNKKGTDS